MNSFTHWEIFKDRKSKKWKSFCIEHNILIEKEYKLFSILSRKTIIKLILTEVLSYRAMEKADYMKIKMTKKRLCWTYTIVQVCDNTEYYTKVEIVLKDHDIF